ncbi:actin related protein 2/3 complex [Heterostelium album PN500]|uniref:Arp2/3 complex 34 kDa subunit n=1 Tax=Heterostelium pallidum (strain ATCC 26659 / Pp 5 / PN500) TaxID=670386 RepID=D3BN12_HETP5|nr:actin related protein 2/3 complex [Heterostelium album PN500]EFA77374.1 actin related protein 2/3 complex [Heterostelium album PN500]|eukprot:XP_020429503.1 actin related protein 2/3 complex [Heterostelium album PN500]
MILLETSNRILFDEVFNFNGEKRIYNIFADFDGVKFHTHTSEDKQQLFVSIQFKGAADLLKNGGQTYLKAVYGPLLQAKPEPGYDITLIIDVNAPNKEELAHKVSQLKRNLMAAPFLMVFDAIESKKATPEIISIDYRSDESFYIKTQGDNVTVIFDIIFKDSDDIVLSKIFLQAFVDVRKTLNNVPSVSFSQKDPPLELKGVRGVRAGVNHGFVSINLFPGHIKKAQETADLIQTFRDYLHYHIKCAKGYMHTSMRNRVDGLLQVLNRAKPEPVNTVKRTFKGKFFKQS